VAVAIGETAGAALSDVGASISAGSIDFETRSVVESQDDIKSASVSARRARIGIFREIRCLFITCDLPPFGTLRKPFIGSQKNRRSSVE
jgi:hypothetical protein